MRPNTVAWPRSENAARFQRLARSTRSRTIFFNFEAGATKTTFNWLWLDPKSRWPMAFTMPWATDTRLVFGPTADGARLEADKAFAKQLMRSANVPTADARMFTIAEDALEYVRAKTNPA